MDIVSILSGIKGKVLDATYFELLKHSYELQNQNIEQLKSNNEALKESNQLLQEKMSRLEKDSTSLLQKVEELKKQVPVSSGQVNVSNLSEVAVAILKLYLSRDVTEMFPDEMTPSVPYSQIQVEAAIDELVDAEIIFSGGGMVGRGMSYSLTQDGTRLLAKGL